LRVRRLYIDWPYAKEAFCLAVLDATTSYEMNVSVQKNQLEVIANVHTPARAAEFKKQVTMISGTAVGIKFNLTINYPKKKKKKKRLAHFPQGHSLGSDNGAAAMSSPAWSADSSRWFYSQGMRK